MATVTDSTRTMLPKRVAIAVLVCIQLMSSGCRSPWRSWRNEEPSLEQLLMHPEPWDAEARLQQESATRRAGSPASGDKSSNDKSIRRADPYAARGNDGRAAESSAADPSDERTSQAEFEAAYAAAPPHLRGLLKRQWEATQSLSAGQVAGDLRSSKISDASSDEGTRTKSALARPLRASDAAVSYRLSDDEVETPEFDSESPDGGLSERGLTATARELTASNQAVRKSRAAQSDLADEEGTVTYALDNAEHEGAAEPSMQRKGRLEELTPPPTKKAARQIAHAPPIDTGAGDEVLVKPKAAANQREPGPKTVAADKSQTKSPTKSTPAEAPASYVSPASAEATGPSESAVASAVAEEPSADQAKEIGWRDHIREALRQLEEESPAAADSPAEQLHRQATSRMLRLALGELEPALQPIEGLQTHEQEFFRHEFQSLHDAIDPKGNPVLSRRWTLALDSHRKAMAHLAAVSNLEIKNATFCTDVQSFGVVSKFAHPHFQPNQELLLYCELDNFSAEPVKDGYETQLQGSYEIVDASGRRVADMLLPEDADICRNPRRDYFIAYRIYMPQKIEPGRYQLRLTIEDMKGRKFGQTALDFQIKS